MDARRIKGALTAVCVLATITAGMLALVEIGSFFLLRRATSETPTRSLYVYEGQPWAKTHWREYDSSRKQLYQPYVVWRRAPYRGETIVVDAEGLRRTEHSHCDSKAFTIYMFGGSTLWGTGSPDWGTIPSLLAEMYEKAGRPVCVWNYGESAWVSTQQVVKLLLELKRTDRKPDLVLFYDGINDVFASWQSGGLDVHQNFDRIKAQFETRGEAKEGTFNYLLLTNTLQLLQRTAARRRPDAGRGDMQRAAEATATHYFRNIDVVDVLAKHYGFAYAFFWQPVIFTDAKPLTAEEKGIRGSRSKAWPGAEQIYQSTYERVRAADRRNLFYIADTFDSYKGNLYLDFAHVPPEGNRLVAARMYEILQRLRL